MKTILVLIILSVASSNSCREPQAAGTETKEDTAAAYKNAPASTNDYFTLIRATSQEWVAGIRGGGRGTDYSFRLEITTDKELQFDTVWMKNRAYPLFVTKDKPGDPSQPGVFSKGDVIVLSASGVEYEQAQSQGYIEQEPPQRFDGEALVGFRVDGNRMFFVIQEIEVLEPSYRP
jgi:hypothetical protein